MEEIGILDKNNFWLQNVTQEFYDKEILNKEDYLTARNYTYSLGFKRPLWESGTYIEGMTPEQLEALNTARAVEIDNEYTDLIFEVEKKHLGKKMREPNYVYPQITLDEINRLRAECNQKILEETGISDYNYRKAIPKLAY